MHGTSLPDLIALAYESACDPAGMARFIAEAAAYFRADSAALAIWAADDPTSLLPLTFGLDPDAVVGWFQERERPTSLFRQLETTTPLRLLQAEEAMTEAGWAPGNVLATLVERDEANHCALLLLRHTAPFSAADRDTLASLVGYLQRAIQVNKRFVRLFAEQRAVRTVLDNAPRGILVLGQRGQATYINGEARRILGNKDGIGLVGDRPVPADTAAAAILRDFLDRARQTDGGERPPMAGIRIPRSGSRPDYQLIAYGLSFNSRQAALDEREGLAVAMLNDPLTMVTPDETLLDTYFDLTPAEAKLSQILCNGHTLPAAARELSVSVNTARTHLRSVFRKVGVHSQAALVQRVSQSLHLASPFE
jgi:DNA-binding CsgD family transcriptional regulator/PAS domain-containing protein